jgi:hypothetical protein
MDFSIELKINDKIIEFKRNKFADYEEVLNDNKFKYKGLRSLYKLMLKECRETHYKITFIPFKYDYSSETNGILYDDMIISLKINNEYTTKDVDISSWHGVNIKTKGENYACFDFEIPFSNDKVFGHILFLTYKDKYDEIKSFLVIVVHELTEKDLEEEEDK